tara:strand:+ start:12025 stop:13527 length:1503 start_codon:yes stop_codon:yes gene_type:complete
MVNKKTAATRNGKPKTKTKTVKAELSTAIRNMEKMMEESTLLIDNSVQSRSHFMEKLLDPRRDINDDCGYPDDPTIDDFLELYDREGIAERSVDILPAESWKSTPSVYENDDTDDETEFELAFKNLLRYEDDSYSPEEECHPLWDYLERADKISGIGRYGVIFLGFTDGLLLSEEVQPKEKMELAYLRVFHEADASIASMEENQDSPRFGMPTSYNLGVGTSTSDGTKTAVKVHWTRVIHIADNLKSNEVFAVSRMRSNFNRLMDIRKLAGGSAEMYWRGAFPGLTFSPNPNIDIETVSIDTSALRDSVEQYQNSLQRYLYAEGLETKALSPTVVDPSPQVRIQLEALCVQLGCPLRIFLGSERGELASSQDSDSWESRLKKRRSKYIAPRIIAKVVNRLIKYGALPTPTNGFKIKWENTNQLPEEVQAKITEARIKAIAAYIQSDADNLIAPEDLLVRFLGFSKDESAEIIKAGEKYLSENPEEELEISDESQFKSQEE